MTFSFRNRIFLGLVTLGVTPLAVAVLVLTLQTRTSSSLAGPRAALDDIVVSGRDLQTTFDSLELQPAARGALRRHADLIASGSRLTRRAETLSRISAAALATVVLISGVGVVGASIYLAKRWSRTVSEPVENLIGLIRRIERRERLQPAAAQSGSPEIRALTEALYQLSEDLELARRRELEQERLVAFREVARRVAHEMRSPVTAARLALDQIRRSGGADSALSVLDEETDRLERMAHEFAEFGRLPEGPRAEIDITELLESAIGATAPPNVIVKKEFTTDLCISGHYEPLRRAVQNLIANAIEATDDRGIEVRAGRDTEPDRVTIHVRDYGSGVPADQTSRIFEPYVTTKPQGTGLGLAMVKQIVEAHGGTVAVDPAAGPGATFVVSLPVGAM